MRKILPLFVFAVCFFLPVSSSRAQLTSSLIRVSVVITRIVDKDRTQLVGAPTLTVGGGSPGRLWIGDLELSFTATSDDGKAITIHSRLSEKASDGKIRFVEDVPTITIANGQKDTVRTAGFQLEFAPSFVEPVDRSVNFPGGTLAEFLSWLPKSNILRFDLVAEKAFLDTEIPAFSLRYPSADALAAALNKFLLPRGLNVLPSRSGVSTAATYSTVYVVQKYTDPDAGKPADAARFRSYQLSNYLDEKQTVEQITDAIHAAWELFPNRKSGDLRLKFHPGTSLLLVSGPEDAINAVEVVIASLRPKAGVDYFSNEAKRLEAVAAEVRRRREARSGGLGTTSPDSSLLETAADPDAAAADLAVKKKRLDAVASEIERRRAAREATRTGNPAEPPSASEPVKK